MLSSRVGTACPHVQVASRVPTGTHREGREKGVHIVLGQPGGTHRRGQGGAWPWPPSSQPFHTGEG